ncbi:MAG: hypothetical protein JWQ92_2697 [Amnibacterium sp.]|nr:hypothetical protein [Amnibacterium sp.]
METVGTRLFDIARRLDRGLFPFMGPAQIGAGHAEQPYRPPADPRCPICGGRLADHAVERSADQTTATRLICP